MKLEDVQIGQRVVISPMFNSQPYRFGNVTRITKTRIYVDGIPYNKRNGKKLGQANDYRNESIATEWPEYELMTVENGEAANADKKKETEIALLARRIKDVRYGHLKELGYEKLTQIAALVGLE